MPEPKHTVPKKVKSALNILFTDPKADLAVAAAAVGMPTYTLRRMLKLPHIRKYAYHERRALLDALCMATPASLKDVINNSENSMARVAAVRQVEALRAADHAESVVRQRPEIRAPQSDLWVRWSSSSRDGIRRP
jgi:hypothetical protein